MDKELRALGLEEKEVQIYLSCLSQRDPTPTLVAKLTGLKRATVYFYLERLKEKGLIEWEIHKSRKHIALVPPRRGLKRYIANQKEQIERSEEVVKGILAHMEQMSQVEMPGSKVYHYEGQEGIRFAIDKMLSSRKPLYWFGSMELLLAAAGGEKAWHRIFTARRLQEGTVTYGITDRRILRYPQFSNMKEAKRSYRFLEDDFEIPATLVIFGDSICLGSKQNNELRMVLIENAMMAQTLTFMYKVLWSRLSGE